MIQRIFNGFYSVVYGYLIVALAGFPNVVNATNCGDFITTSNNVTYSQALGVFLYYNGNTYAISKSAITGVTTTPDAYFAMNAGFTQAYLYGGSDFGTLVEQLRDGQYGAAVPVTIPDSVTQQFIIKNYGQYLGNAAGQNGTYVNVWENYSSSTFTQIGGTTSVGFTNWSSGNTPTYTKTPQAVVMGVDGYWNTTSTSGVKLSQIVEFAGQQLDCAVDMSTPGPAPLTPVIPTPPASNAVTNSYCGDGTPADVTSCLASPNGQSYCPLGALACQGSSGVEFNVPIGYGYNQIFSACFPSTSLTENPAPGAGCSQTEIVGYLSPTSFPGSVPVGYGYNQIFSACDPAEALTANPVSAQGCPQPFISGYISGASFSGSVPVGYGYNQIFSACVQSTDLTVNVVPGAGCTQTNIVGYTAPTAGTYLGTYTCPYGSQYACTDISGNGNYQCSPYACVNTVTTAGTTSDMNTNYLQNDGQKDSNGNCLGQTYIFSGQPSRCRPPGLVVGEINDCCAASSQVITDSTGGLEEGVISSLGTLYNLAQVGYGSYLAATQGAEAAGTYASGLNQSTGVTAAIGAAEEAAADGGSAVDAITAGVESFASDLIASPAFIIGVVVFVVMKVLMGSGCDQGDIQTDMSRDSQMCHYVGDFCYKSYPLIGCVQEASGYCCYNSMLARIFAEQGRPQLISFGPDGGWGPANSPNCRGFTPDEFQSLNFNEINLSSYYSVLENNLQQNLTAAQQNIMKNVQIKVNANTGQSTTN